MVGFALTIIPALAVAQDVRWFFTRPILDASDACLTQAREGENLLAQIGPKNPAYAAVSFRTGSLYFNAKSYKDAEAVYKRALRSQNMSRRQNGSLWINLAQSLRAEGKMPEALESFRKAAKFSDALGKDERRVTSDWINRLELQLPDSDLRQKQIDVLIQRMKAGEFSASMPGDIDWVYQNEPRQATKLTDLISARLASGTDTNDFALFNSAISWDPRFEKGLRTRLFEPYVSKITLRMSNQDLSAPALLAKSQFGQSLQISDRTLAERNRTLKLVADQALLLSHGLYSPDQREYGLILVHLLQSLSSSSDAKVQKIIQDSLFNLNGKSIDEKDQPIQVSHSPKGAVAFASGATAIFCSTTFLWLRRRKRNP